tara:strand:- start:1226 stop:1696 length:471 start_codon:yes stop_codon:yes gene_type:complete
MKKLPKILKQIIKKKTFSLNTITNQRDWRGGLNIDYRITMVKSQNEQHYDHLSPINDTWGQIYVNLKVSGMVQMRKTYEDRKMLVEISKATKTTENYWGGYDSKYDTLWGNQVNKKVRKEIRYKVKSQVINFLKLMGIKTERFDSGIVINTINWEQ